MLTMPSYLGWEGINPLTVYYCYTADGKFWIAVLEVHNTFGEAHIYILEAGYNEDSSRPPGYTHQWTLPREFHVSPFNDRAGSYRISLAVPPAPPALSSASSVRTSDPPRPKVRIHLHTPPDPSTSLPETEKEENSGLPQTQIGPLKLTALLIPTHSTALTAGSLLSALSKYPVALLLSLPRILWQARVLHWNKGLDVYLRPEPRALAGGSEGKGGGGVRWQAPGALERYARARVCVLLSRRARETGVCVAMRPNDRALYADVFSPALDLETKSTSGGDSSGTGNATATPALLVTYLAPRAWVIIFASPSAAHARLLGASEGVFTTSDDALFDALFSSPSSSPSGATSLSQHIRAFPLPSPVGSPSYLPPILSTHPLDSASSVRYAADLSVLSLLLLLYYTERWVFNAVGARIVSGGEPWGMWERVEQRLRQGGEEGKGVEEGNWVGSVRRDSRA
ncbi:hypothetical protein FIBSPDRAFT_1036395 [Athelia psychrophila]|uniref:DUF1365-domain-containing protein n=1 Tax=Athelia psychrophila TaxID=1759441 RepID=A0A166W1M7_9AGAM|nr:hypothetical protein FIBSPDRAFT_1036395 [Fibularhizoctonia sp. CBS 109695]